MPVGKGPLIHEWSPSVRNWLLGVFILLVGASLVLGFVTLVEPSLRPGMREWSEIVRNVGLGVFGVLGGSFGLYIAYLRSVAAKDAADAALQASKTAQEKEDRERELDRATQFSESFGRAVEQLGHQDVSVRLGALHALALLAEQSSREHWPIVSILASHVRGASDPAFPGERAAKHLEIQLCINVLSRRNKEYDDPKDVLDLRGSDLRKIEFADGDFSKGRFVSSNFAGARLKSSSFAECDFSECVFDRVDIESSKFFAAVFDKAKWHGGIVKDADLTSTKFVFNDIKSVRFLRADFSDSYVLWIGATNLKFFNCKGIEANWSHSGFKQLEMKDCDFTGANFTCCTLEKSQLAETNLRLSNFGEAEISGANFWNVAFDEAKFSDAKFVDCGFSMTSFSKSTLPPNQIEATRTIPPTHNISESLHYS